MCARAFKLPHAANDPWNSVSSAGQNENFATAESNDCIEGSGETLIALERKTCS